MRPVDINAAHDEHVVGAILIGVEAVEGVEPLDPELRRIVVAVRSVATRMGTWPVDLDEVAAELNADADPLVVGRLLHLIGEWDRRERTAKAMALVALTERLRASRVARLDTALDRLSAQLTRVVHLRLQAERAGDLVVTACRLLAIEAA